MSTPCHSAKLKRWLTTASCCHGLPRVKFCRVVDTRHSINLLSVKFRRVSYTRQRSILPSAIFYRVSDTRQKVILPSVTFYRVQHSAKLIFAKCSIFNTLKFCVFSSGSNIWVSYLVFIWRYNNSGWRQLRWWRRLWRVGGSIMPYKMMKLRQPWGKRKAS